MIKPSIELPISSKPTDLELKKLKEKYEINQLDGIKININENTWSLIRKSNTEDIIRISAESDNEEKCKIIINNIKEMVKEGYGKTK